MQTALRPYATAGVALAGASVIAVSPISVTPTAVQEVRDAAVHLSALENPIEVFTPIIQQAIKNLQAAGQTVIDDPAPILAQIIANQIGNIAGLPAAIEDQIGVIPNVPQILGDALTDGVANVGVVSDVVQTLLQNVITTFTSTGEGTLLGQLQTALDDVQNNDLGGAFSTLFGAGLLAALPALEAVFGVAPVLLQPLDVAQQLFPIVGGPLADTEAALNALQQNVLVLGLSALNPVFNGGTALGSAVSEAIDAAQAGDPEAAFNSLLTGAGLTTKALLDGLADDNGFGLIPALQSLREAIAQAITPPAAAADAMSSVAALPSATAKSITLTAPLEKAPASNPGASSADDASGSGGVATTDPGTATKGSSADTTSTDTRGDVKGGNLFTPGGSTSKGGKHRATDGASFGQELRDAAAKTFKGLTGLVGSKSGTSTAGVGESGSGSSGSSSSSGSGSGSGSK